METNNMVANVIIIIIINDLLFINDYKTYPDLMNQKRDANPNSIF